MTNSIAPQSMQLRGYERRIYCRLICFDRSFLLDTLRGRWLLGRSCRSLDFGDCCSLSFLGWSLLGLCSGLGLRLCFCSRLLLGRLLRLSLDSLLFLCLSFLAICKLLPFDELLNRIDA